MVAITFENYLPSLFDIEKGWSDRPTKEDPGGPTNYGITLETYRAWNNDQSLSKNALMVMPKAEAVKIYKAQYWTPIRADDLPLGVDLAVFDFAVNSGPGRAVLSLQEVLGVKQDGVIGPITMDAITSYPGTEYALITDYASKRLDFMKGLSNWTYNKNGWTKRVKRVMTEAQSLMMVKDYTPDMGTVQQTPKANADNVSVSKALISKETATILTVAIPSISGLLTNFQPIQYVIAAFVGGFGLLALYMAYKRVKKTAI